MEEEKIYKVDQITKWAESSPVGFFGCAVCCITVWVMGLGWVPPSGTLVAMTWIIFAGVALLYAGAIALARGEFVPGTLMSVFGIFFCLAFASSFFVGLLGGKFLGQPLDLGMINGIMCLVLALICFTYSPIFTRISSFVFAAFIILGLGLVFAGLLFMGVCGAWAIVTYSWLIGIGGLMVLYITMSAIVNAGLGRVVLWMPGPMVH